MARPANPDKRIRQLVAALDRYTRETLLAQYALKHPDPDRVVEILCEAVHPGLDLDIVGRILWVAEQIGRASEQRRIFDLWRPGLRATPPPIDFVRVPAGEFLMGSLPTEPMHDETQAPKHRVVMPSFELGRTPVTFAQLRCLLPAADGPGPQFPVSDLSWWAARAFAWWCGARLPSESEWEYACRAGTTTPWWCGDDPAQIVSDEWFGGDFRTAASQPEPLLWDPLHRHRPGTPWYLYRHAVGRSTPNPWGLFDMQTSVQEWCEDAFLWDYEKAPLDGSANQLTVSPVRAVRGIFWDSPFVVPSAYRHNLDACDGAGFRVARSVAS